MPPHPVSALAPLEHTVFRSVWSAALVANLCMWMSDMAAAWMMTTLAAAPLWVALVQSAATLPVFLLGLPSGALADMLDRRRFLVATQCWSAAVAISLCLVKVSGAMTPALLLALTFANGVGLALRWPVLAALVPTLVPRPQLPAALALNGVSMNASRLAGPLLAGALISTIGVEAVFVVNALLSVGTALVLLRLRRFPVPAPRAPERLGVAIGAGLQFVVRSVRVKAVLLRVGVFFFHSTCLIALLPLVVHERFDGAATTFSMLFGCMGGGAILAAGILPRLRLAFDRDALVLRGVLLHAGMSALVALSHHLALSMAAMALSGMAWMVTVNSLSVSVQLALPDWVRARGMSIYQMALMGGSALGAAVWGQVATLASFQVSLLLAAASAVAAMLITLRYVQDRGEDDDVGP
jgi:MFS family permease